MEAVLGPEDSKESHEAVKPGANNHQSTLKNLFQCFSLKNFTVYGIFSWGFLVQIFPTAPISYLCHFLPSRWRWRSPCRAVYKKILLEASFPGVFDHAVRFLVIYCQVVTQQLIILLCYTSVQHVNQMPPLVIRDQKTLKTINSAFSSYKLPSPVCNDTWQFLAIYNSTQILNESAISAQSHGYWCILKLGYSCVYYGYKFIHNPRYLFYTNQENENGRSNTSSYII